MSYDYGLYYGEEPAEVEPHDEISAIVLGGSSEARISVTSNHATLFRLHLDEDHGLGWIREKTGAETIERLEQAVEGLKERAAEGPEGAALGPRYSLNTTKRSTLWGEILEKDWTAPENADLLRRALEEGVVYELEGYWRPTPENAATFLSVMLVWARRHPEAVWYGG